MTLTLIVNNHHSNCCYESLSLHYQPSELLKHFSLSSFPCLSLFFPKSHTCTDSLLIYTLLASHHMVSPHCRAPVLLTVQCNSVQCRGHSQGKERTASCWSTCKKLKNVLSKFGFTSSRYGPQKKCEKGIVAYECAQAVISTHGKHSKWHKTKCLPKKNLGVPSDNLSLTFFHCWS